MYKVLAHEKLIVYEKSLAFIKTIAPVIDAWPSKYAICDQMDRASESLIINLVKAAGESHQEQKVYYLECSIGSALECAACLDIAYIKQLIDSETAKETKVALQTIVRMEYGLRKSWFSSLHEETETYDANPDIFFIHESLRVYQCALHVCQVLDTNVLAATERWDRYTRRSDESITSLILNIAEGNGRFSKLDHNKFIVIAEDAGIRLSAYFDLITASASANLSSIKTELREVLAMIAGMKGYLTKT